MKTYNNKYPYEIERKYLVDIKKWNEIEKPEGEKYIQGYIVNKSSKNVRIRICHKNAFITIKGKRNGATRTEFEYQIPAGDAEMMLRLFTKKQIEKTRYHIYHKGKIWEVDEFSGENEGLIIAEIELDSEDEKYTIPEWIGKEVTEDKHYYNGYLVKNPYCTWKNSKEK